MNEHPLLNALRQQFIVPGHCGMVTDETTLPQMIELIKTPKGGEHCTKHNLPTLDILTALRDQAPEYWYIERQGSQLRNPHIVILAGHTTTARIEVDGTNECQLIMLHGATADITARDFATVRIDRAEDTTITIHKEDTAFVYDNYCITAGERPH